MGRLIFMMLALIIFLMILSLVTRFINKPRQMTREEQRKSFNEDIETLAKKIKSEKL